MKEKSFEKFPSKEEETKKEEKREESKDLPVLREKTEIEPAVEEVEAELVEEDSPEIKKRISELPDNLREFFSRMDPEMRRVVCSDEGLLERSNEHLEKLYNMMLEDIEKKGAKPLFDRFTEAPAEENSSEGH